MKEYQVEVNINGRYVVTVQAENRKEAEDEACDIATDKAYAAKYEDEALGVEFEFNWGSPEIGWVLHAGEDEPEMEEV